MGLTLNLKQSKVTICIVLQGLKEVIMNTFATAIMLTVVTLLFMPTTSQPTPSDQPHTEHPEGTPNSRRRSKRRSLKREKEPLKLLTELHRCSLTCSLP